MRRVLLVALVLALMLSVFPWSGPAEAADVTHTEAQSAYFSFGRSLLDANGSWCGWEGGQVSAFLYESKSPPGGLQLLSGGFLELTRYDWCNGLFEDYWGNVSTTDARLDASLKSATLTVNTAVSGWQWNNATSSSTYQSFPVTASLSVTPATTYHRMSTEMITSPFARLKFQFNGRAGEGYDEAVTGSVVGGSFNFAMADMPYRLGRYDLGRTSSVVIERRV